MPRKGWASWQARVGLLLAALLWAGQGLAQAAGEPEPVALRLAGIFSDHMVLQHGQPIRVWGRAPAGDHVAVRFRGERRHTTAGPDGRWQVTLRAAPPGGPHTLTVQGRQTRVLSDIQVGEVWLCAGQSNMEWTLAQSDGGAQAVAEATQPLIRHVKLPHRALLAPDDDTPPLAWQVASPATAGNFTGVGYFFARQRQAQRRMAIGLVNVAWGGTHLETWSRAASLSADAQWAPLVARQPRTLADWAETQTRGHQATLARFQAGLPGGTVDEARGWAEPGHADSHWPTLQVPQVWEEQGLPGFDGVVWFRREVVLDATQAAAPATLHLGAIDDCDETWVNGQRVGGVCAWDQPRRYPLQAGVLQAGRNVIAVRVTDTGGGGGFHGDPAAVKLELGVQSLALAGPWKARIEAALPKPQPHANDGLSLLFNGMVQPLQPLRLQGVLWYQGESNVPRAAQYAQDFPRLIRDWRQWWGQPGLPFHFVQLASFLPLDKNTLAGSAWAELRDAQRQALALPRTGMVVATDVGDAKDIHPRNKQAVGERLARVAAYPGGPRGRVDGPVLQSARAQGGSMHLQFAQAPGGLALRAGSGDRLLGLAIAGADQRFVAAQARIVGRQIVVGHPDVPKPVAGRYGGGDNPEQANLVDRQGLPAMSFRTDTWPLLTEGVRFSP
ncbi:MAG: sialate O-acetylesterase [Burkholderiales bacterium PBB5]|nr:MAG: sialate O-acetylesterase [Burkholderiales bacterium PBB5]